MGLERPRRLTLSDESNRELSSPSSVSPCMSTRLWADISSGNFNVSFTSGRDIIYDMFPPVKVFGVF